MDAKHDVLPKVIHYCWFGKNKIPPNLQECIDSWKKIMPEYKIVRWDEENFDINSNRFAKEAYKAKKWAFVADYVRLYALYNYGGIYMDADVKALKPLDRFLQHKVFSGYENKKFLDVIPTGTIGAVKGHEYIKDLLDHYKDKSFLLPSGKPDLNPNVRFMSEIAREKYGFRGDGKHQVFGDDIHMYPFDYFSCYTGEKEYGNKDSYEITENSYTIHLFNGSWHPLSKKLRLKIRKIIGYDTYYYIKSLIPFSKRNKKK